MIEKRELKDFTLEQLHAYILDWQKTHETFVNPIHPALKRLKDGE